MCKLQEVEDYCKFFERKKKLKKVFEKLWNKCSETDSSTASESSQKRALSWENRDTKQLPFQKIFVFLFPRSHGSWAKQFKKQSSVPFVFTKLATVYLFSRLSLSQFPVIFWLFCVHLGRRKIKFTKGTGIRRRDRADVIHGGGGDESNIRNHNSKDSANELAQNGLFWAQSPTERTCWIFKSSTQTWPQ